MDNEVSRLQEKVQELQETVTQLSQKLDFYRDRYEEYLQNELQDREKRITELKREMVTTINGRYL